MTYQINGIFDSEPNNVNLMNVYTYTELDDGFERRVLVISTREERGYKGNFVTSVMNLNSEALNTHDAETLASQIQLAARELTNLNSVTLRSIGDDQLECSVQYQDGEHRTISLVTLGFILKKFGYEGLLQFPISGLNNNEAKEA